MVLYGPTIEHRNNSYNMKLSTFYYLMLDVTYRQYILLSLSDPISGRLRVDHYNESKRYMALE